jgi:GNAT superfamily N-acetyltransferase
MVHSLRRATAADAEAIAGVHVRAWQEAYRAFLPADVLAALSVEERLVAWDQTISDAAALIVVAENNEHGISGFSATFLPSRDDDATDTVCEVAALYVEPDRWRRGIGRALLRAALDKATGDGYESATVWLFEENAAGRSFYETFGFKPDGETRVEPDRPAEIRLRLNLA